jgi:predicted site-specific integrase-resolvase
VNYHSVAGVLEVTGVSRQTLWRWRREGKVPAGHRFRDKLLVFTVEELEQILQFANRLEPIDCSPRRRLNALKRDL